MLHVSAQSPPHSRLKQLDSGTHNDNDGAAVFHAQRLSRPLLRPVSPRRRARVAQQKSGGWHYDIIGGRGRDGTSTAQARAAVSRRLRAYYQVRGHLNWTLSRAHVNRRGLFLYSRGGRRGCSAWLGRWRSNGHAHPTASNCSFARAVPSTGMGHRVVRHFPPSTRMSEEVDLGHGGNVETSYSSYDTIARPPTMPSCGRCLC